MNFRILTALLLVVTSISNAWGTTLTVGLLENNRYPYFYRDLPQGNAQGLYIDVLNFISSDSGIQFEYRFLPSNRIREYMKYGLLDVEPGIDESWRLKPQEIENSVYSTTFLSSDEVLAYNPNLYHQPPTISQLRKMPPCQVTGFNGPKHNSTKRNMDIDSESKLLQMIYLERCHWAQLPMHIIQSNYHSQHLNHTPTVATYELKLRLNKHHAHLLPQINRSLSRLIESGKLDLFVEHYIGGNR